MNIQDLVSVITSAYNCEKFISQTIDSVLSQTYTNWERNIVNDKSIDNTENIIEEHVQKDSRIRLINLSENSGAAVVSNTAPENDKGRFVAFLDSDDRWKKDKLRKQLQFTLQNKYVFTSTVCEYIKYENNGEEKVFKVPYSLNYSQGLKNTVIGCLTVVIDKHIVCDYRMPLVRRGQDNLNWLKLLEKGHIA